MKVLYVEDDDNQRETGISVLSGVGGYDVQTASNGIDAMTILKNFSADLIITDKRLPLMEGPELIRKAKKIRAAIRTVLISADSDVHQLALQCGADRAFKKPFPWGQVLIAIDDMCKKPKAQKASR